MADLATDIRLAVDSGTTALGMNSVIDSIKNNSAKLVVIATNAKKELRQDIMHIAKLAAISVINFEGTPVDLGAVCGKSFSVAVVSIIEPGNSSILANFK
jgi:large subunit ribosomal protein L30e